MINMIHKDLLPVPNPPTTETASALLQISGAVRESSIPPYRTAGRLVKSALHQAVINGRTHQAKLLLSNGSDVNASVSTLLVQVHVQR